LATGLGVAGAAVADTADAGGADGAGTGDAAAAGAGDADADAAGAGADGASETGPGADDGNGGSASSRATIVTSRETSRPNRRACAARRSKSGLPSTVGGGASSANGRINSA
jgi:hypothetical protein